MKGRKEKKNKNKSVIMPTTNKEKKLKKNFTASFRKFDCLLSKVFEHNNSKRANDQIEVKV